MSDQRMTVLVVGATGSIGRLVVKEATGRDTPSTRLHAMPAEHAGGLAAYLNERQVGDGLRPSGVPRDEVFLETKVWISDYGYDATLDALRTCGRSPDIEIKHAPDMVTAKLPALRAYQHSLRRIAPLRCGRCGNTPRTSTTAVPPRSPMAWRTTTAFGTWVSRPTSSETWWSI